MTNKDKSTEKLRELIETREVYRVYLWQKHSSLLFFIFASV